MLMTKKKKIKIARMLATVLHTVETDLDIPCDTLDKAKQTPEKTGDTVDIGFSCNIERSRREDIC